MLLLLAFLTPAYPFAAKRSILELKPKKKKKKIKKQPRLPTPPPPQVHATPQQHMTLVKNAVERNADALCAGLRDDGLYVGEGFLDAAAVVAMAGEARTLDPILVPSQSTRWDGTATVAYDKEGVRSTQILGGTLYEQAPRLTEYVVSLTEAVAEAVNGADGLRRLSPAKQTNKLAVCDAPGAAYPKHIDNGGADDPRLLTCIVYLAGAPAGGNFRAYAPTEDAVVRDVAPAPGTFVAFWSDRLVHDVSEVTACAGPGDARWALTVWLCAEDEADVETTPDEVLRVHFPEAAT